MNDEFYKIGVDLGGTKTEAVILDNKEIEIFRKRVPTPRQDGEYNHEDEYLNIVTNLCDLIQNTINEIPNGANYTIGIGTPGSIDPSSGLIRNSNTICLNKKPLKTDIENRLKRIVGMLNDSNCFCQAESLLGAGKDYRVVFGIILGTGCGGGICIDGLIHNGRNGIGGEWGHISIDPEGSPCYCGNRGCIETLISGTGVENRFYSHYGYRKSMEDIVIGYKNGDPNCLEMFNQFLEDFGRAAGGMISLFDPDAVVIGGGLSNIEELYTKGADQIRKFAFHDHVDTPVLRNKLGDSAGVIGAALVGC